MAKPKMADATDSHIDPDKWLKHSRLLSASRIKIAEATSENQSVLRTAKSDGIPIDSMKEVNRLNRKDPAEAAAYLRGVIEGALVQGCAFMSQADILNGGSLADMLKVSSASPEAIRAFKEDEAMEIGYNEGTQGGTLENLNKQFPVGSPSYLAAAEGFRRGRSFMEGNAQPGVSPVTGGRGRRGGRGKAAAEEVETEVSESSEGLEGHAPKVSGHNSKIDMLKVNKMTNVQMAAFYNELTGANLPKFESKPVGLAKLTELYERQQRGEDLQES